jgi:hypothetical protein
MAVETRPGKKPSARPALAVRRKGRRFARPCVAGIHVFLLYKQQNIDGRNKSGHDDLEVQSKTLSH